jgi:hypothetical protein
MLRTVAIIGAVIAVIAAVALGAMYYVAGTPQYSLYLVQRAIHEGDADTFYQHFDTSRVVQHALERKLGGIPAGPRIVSQKAEESLIPAADRLLRERIDERLAEPSGLPLLGMELDGVTYRNEAAIATLRDPNDGSTTTLTLMPGVGRHWKIVAVDLERANVTFDLDEVRQRAEDFTDPNIPESARPGAGPLILPK